MPRRYLHQALPLEVIVEERANPADLRENLTSLRSQSLKVMALSMALISHAALLVTSLRNKDSV